MPNKTQKTREENTSFANKLLTYGAAGVAGMTLYRGLEQLSSYASVKAQMLAHVFPANEPISQNGRALYEAATRATIDIASGEDLKGSLCFLATAVLATSAYFFSKKR